MESVDYYLCPENHVIPATSQFYVGILLEGRTDANLNPLTEEGMHCSCCERAYPLDELKEKQGDKGLAALAHDVQLLKEAGKWEEESQ